MRLIILPIALFLLFLVSGCSYHQRQDDLADNQYYRKKTISNSNAQYVGNWVRETTKWNTVIRIDNNGRSKIFLHPDFGSCDGKVYLDDESPSIIFKDGIKARIISSSIDKGLTIGLYGKEENYAFLPKFQPKTMSQ